MNSKIDIRRSLTAGVGIAVLGASIVACGGGDDQVSLETSSYELGEVNDSGFHGEVWFASVDDNRTVIVVALGDEDRPAGDFPVAIQQGDCEGLSGEVRFDLGELSSGLLNAEVEASRDTLESDHALVVFESGDRSVYVACTDL